MLWICPYFSPDCETFRLLNKKGYFLKDKRGGTYIASGGTVTAPHST